MLLNFYFYIKKTLILNVLEQSFIYIIITPAQYVIFKAAMCFMEKALMTYRVIDISMCKNKMFAIEL